MNTFFEIITYIFLFLTFYLEVFILISFFEDQETRTDPPENPTFPNVTILVPCWNEEKTIEGTLDSLMHLEYPQEKIEVIVIDDGSTDSTPEVLQRYTNTHPITVIRQNNQGKFEALNNGVRNATHPIIGCLDADSFVDSMALRNIIHRFEDPRVMAVTPSTVVWQPKTLIQHMQKAEYHYGNFIRFSMGLLESVHIAPGPFSFFRKEVFEKIGPYKHAHNTEDMEIAMRMQKNRMKIVNAPDAIVYTASPATLRKLYKQRVRWVSGFMNNLLDYRSMFFNKKYGNLGILILPTIVLGMILMLPFLFINIKNLITLAADKLHFIYLRTQYGWDIEHFDPFFINTSTVGILSLMMAMMFILILAWGRKLTTNRWQLSWDYVLLALYTIITPLWFLRSLYNALFRRKTVWR